ncbi:MAG: LemA family protein [Clostridia bacterium]|nr:LemA family protein [Clostridia bacterium]
MLNLLGLSSGAIIAIVLGAFVGLILLGLICVVLYVWVCRNNLVRLKNNVEEAFSTMDVYMKKRYDLVPNLVETVKGYTKHENQTLKEVVAARNLAMGAQGAEKAKADGAFGKQLMTYVSALAEQYPDLKANANFIDLQSQLKKLEEDIAYSRKYYNGTVKEYNNKVEMFPSNLVAKRFGFEKKEMFVVEDAEERKTVKVKF